VAIQDGFTLVFFAMAPSAKLNVSPKAIKKLALRRNGIMTPKLQSLKVTASYGPEESAHLQPRLKNLDERS
jgi:hypothetical protein